MKIKEWLILGFLLLILGQLFIGFDRTISIPCTALEMEYNEFLSCQIFSEIYDPFIYAFYGVAIICWIMAIVNWIDNKIKR